MSSGLSALYRLFHRHGLMDQSPKAEDRRKFEAELVNNIWQSDVMHGPKEKEESRDSSKPFAVDSCPGRIWHCWSN
jgi:hypothetical protein